MFLMLIVILIISINKTCAYIIQDSEIILLPAWNPTGAKEISLTLKVFGKLMQLKLQRNGQIASPVFEVLKNNAKGVTEKLSELKASNFCFYFHENHISSAAINFCQEHGLEGFVFVENDILEIQPLRMFAPLYFINDSCVREVNQSFGKLHLIKRSLQYFDSSDNDEDNNDDDDNWSTFDNLLSPDDLPGREQTAKAQCELFLHNENANVVTLHNICRNLQCETPHTNASYFTKRALNGTYCALGKECFGGKCVPVIEPPYIFKYCEEDNWSEWKKDSCVNHCLEKSKGVLVKRRFCKHRGQRTANCVGLYYDVVLCDYSLRCTERKSANQFATIKCEVFKTLARLANMKFELSKLSKGKQIPHNVEKPWIACTVFCQQKETDHWYAPRQPMLDYGVDPYFPDGTWCHNKDGQDYYCRQHYCLPENYSFEAEFS